MFFPINYIYRQLTPEQEVTALLLFNMLAAGYLPPSEPGALHELG